MGAGEGKETTAPELLASHKQPLPAAQRLLKLEKNGFIVRAFVASYRKRQLSSADLSLFLSLSLSTVVVVAVTGSFSSSDRLREHAARE